MSMSRRVAESYFEYRYAQLILAMSLSEAKEILGFPPSISPSLLDVKEAYRSKAFENHPDRGGDTAKMVDINVAKDILMGERPPTGAPRRRPGPPQPPGGWQPEDKYEPPAPPPPVEGKSFSQVMSSMPGGVEWKFISGSAYHSGAHLRPEGEGLPYNSYNYGWVLYGQTENNHIFAGIRVTSNNNSSMDKTLAGDGWEGFHTSAPRKLNLIRLAPKMVKGIIDGLPGLEKSRVRPKKYQVLTGPVTRSTLKNRAGLTLKDAIIGSGSMPASSSGLKGRKKVVTIDPVYDRAKFKALKEELGRVMGDEYHRAFNWNVEVNGRGRTLDDKEVEALNKSGFLWSVYKFDYEKGKKNLSRLRGGKWLGADAGTALKLLYDALHGGPLKTEIGEAAEQMASTKKAAVDLAAEMPTSHVAMLLDESLLSVFKVVTRG
jgi:hypothetical protein